MESSISSTVREAGRELTDASGINLVIVLNQVLNRLIGGPFRATTGFMDDSEGRKTDTFSTLIYANAQSISQTEPLNIHADALACVLDVYESMDVENLHVAYERIARVKRLKKTPAPSKPGAPYTSVTLGIIFAADTKTPLEKLAVELDLLNNKHPDREWTDMVVVLKKGTINYVAQFPGDQQCSDLLPPAEGAMDTYIPPVYVNMAIFPARELTINKMFKYLFAHLVLFSPSARLPSWTDLQEGTPQKAIMVCGYQYNLSGQLVPVPRQFYNDRYIPPRKFIIEDSQGEFLATIQFLPWQDGGVVLLQGMLPLEGLLIFIDKKTIRQGETIRRPKIQISYVLPITHEDFIQMLKRIHRQSNMIVKPDQTKWIIQKIADEGSSSVFIARVHLGILNMRDNAIPDHSELERFDKAFEFIITTLMITRATAQRILTMLAEHIRKVSQGEIARIRGGSIQIDLAIDNDLRKEVESFINSATRAIKEGMQELAKILQVDLGFLFQKSAPFEEGARELGRLDPFLAAYLLDTRKWSERLLNIRNSIEHEGWMLPKIMYVEASGVIRVEESQISGQPMSEFIRFMMDRLICFVEEVTMHCLQAKMPASISITEIPISKRAPEAPERFRITLADGGMPIWKIFYHESTFEET